MSGLVLEVVTRRGAVVERVRVPEAPATIGRAYANTLIVDDPMVDPVHARITYDPERDLHILHDLDSVNGVRPAGSRSPEREIVLRPGTTVRLGRTLVRVGFVDQAVAPAVSEAGSSTFHSKMLSWPAGLLSAFAMAAIFGLSTYLFNTSETRGIEASVGVVMFLMLIAMWAGVWALVSRFTKGRFGFLSHVAVVSWALLLWTIATTSASAIDYLRNVDWAVWVLGGGAALLGFGWMIWAHLGLASSLRSSVRWLVTAGVIAGFTGLGWLALQAAKEPTDDVWAHLTGLQPLPASWIRTESVEDFIDGLDDLVDELEALDANE